ncbi:DNA polymerase III subunit delta [bacterium]|nr:DNA polymerase III subunit delta [bacterium]
MAFVSFRLNKNKIEPIYFFHGEEDYLKNLAVSQVVSAVLKPEDHDFNFNKFDAEEFNLSKILDSLVAFPMFAERRLVIVTSIEKFDQKSKKMLLDYVEKPLLSTCLVLVASNKVDTKTAFYKNLAEKSVIFDFRPLYDSEVPDWILDFVSQRGKKINLANAGMLASYVGNSIRDLTSEIEKLLINLKELEITHQDIETITSSIKNFDVFSLRNAVGRKDLKVSLEILNNIFERDDKAGIFIVIQLFSLFANLWKLCSKELANKTSSEIATKRLLDTPVEFFVKEFLQMKKNYSKEEIEKVFTVLMALDTSFKSVQTEQKFLLETALTKIIKNI